MSGFLRLRQICLVAPDLDRISADIESVLGLQLCFRDAAVAKYGLVNALFPIGTDFIEVVTPTREGTTAGRFMQASGGRGAYMAIFDCDDPQQRRAHITGLGIRIAHSLDYHGFWGTQFHPKDCRATMMEFDRTTGGEDPMGPYHPAGPDWQRFVDTRVTRRLLAAELESPDAAGLAAHWSRICDVPLSEDGRTIALRNSSHIRFADAPAGSRESLATLVIEAVDPKAMMAAAQRAGLPASGEGFLLGGVRFVPR